MLFFSRITSDFPVKLLLPYQLPNCAQGPWLDYRGYIAELLNMMTEQVSIEKMQFHQNQNVWQDFFLFQWTLPQKTFKSF